MRIRLLSITLSLIAAACAADPAAPGAPDAVANPAEVFDRGVRELPALSQLQPLASPSLVSSATTRGFVDGRECETVSERFRAAPGYDELMALDPATDVIWPGALLLGASVLDGRYLPVPAPRGALTLSASLPNLKGPVSRTVTNARLSVVRQALADLLVRGVDGSTPARVCFSVEEVRGEEQLRLAVGAQFADGLDRVKAQFDFNDTRVRSRVLVKFMQVYYTVDVDPPLVPSAFFAQPADWRTVLSQLGNMTPVYVSGMSYGRMVLFSFESDCASEELIAALKASFGFLSVDVTATLDTRHRTVLDRSTIRAVVIGGNGATAAGIVNGVDGLRTHLASGGNLDAKSPGAPLAYRLRSLQDNSLLSIVLAAEYTVRTVRPLTRGFTVGGFSLRCDAEDDGGDEAEFFGSLAVSVRTNGITVPVCRGSQGCDGTVWNVPENRSDDWSLRAGESRTCGETLAFRIADADRPRAWLRIQGRLLESDPFASDDLGLRTLEIPLADAPSGDYRLEGFVDGGTRASFGFTLAAVP